MKKNIRLVTGAIILLFAANTLFAQNSVLSSGNWYKIAVENTGIHRITYDDLLDYGIDPGQLNPKFIRLYGNGNGMLPEDNDEFRYEDLQENSIFVSGEDDGTFDPGDYVLFYGEVPTEWNLNEISGLFEHEINLYSDFTFYFLNFDLGDGKRIQTQYSTIIPPTYTSTSFDDYSYHELELENLIHSGREWFGERFEETTVYNFPVSFPNLATNSPVCIEVSVAARSYLNSIMQVGTVTQEINSLQISPTNSSNLNADYAKQRSDTSWFYPTGPYFEIVLIYDQPTDSSVAWLNYFTLNAKRENIFDSGQISFRDIESTGPSMITTFQMSAQNGNINIWNVSDPLNAMLIGYTYSNGMVEYILETDSLLEFIAFDESQFFSPEYIGEVENQNLHAVEPVDLVIVTHSDFLIHAQQLANFREANDGLTTFVTTPEKIYNEYSSGAQDITAIRDFIKYLYDKSNGEKPEYLLLFGDASFDFKNIAAPNTNFIPGWESPESLNPVSSYFSDNFYVEFGGSNLSNLGIGRLPSKTPEEANILVQKIIHYSSSENAYGSWRNDICFIADDEDANLHYSDAEQLANIVDTSDHVYNISKIYLDAYEQIITPDGPIYPDVNKAITDKINCGVNLINYIGHGFYNGLAHEKIFAEEDIGNWENDNYYPLLIAATCDFGRFDDPDRYSLAEKALLLEGKGMSGIIAPTRATYAGANRALSINIFKILCEYPQYTLGKILMLAKQQTGSNENKRKFCLLGDPSMHIAIPLHNIVTEAINGVSVFEPLDTINPGEQIIVSGYIEDMEGNTIYNFNGIMEVRVFDRIDTISTLGNDPQSPIRDFLVRDSILLTSNTEIINGQFAFAFNLPFNFSEEYGTIKLSYYGRDYPLDARGEFSEVVVGGPASAIPEKKTTDDMISFYPTLVATELNYLAKQNIDNLQLELFDLSGRKLFSYSEQNIPEGKRSRLNISELNPGMYIMRINAGNNISSMKLIKR